MLARTAVKIRVYALNGDDLGEVHVPPPVWPGDLLAFRSGPPMEVLAVIHAPDRQAVGVTACPVPVQERELRSP